MINVTALYEGWLSGLSHNALRDTVLLPNGRKPSKSTIRYWLVKNFGNKACDRKSNSLRRSLYQDLIKGKLKVSSKEYDAVKRWIISTPSADLTHPKYYAEGEMFRDASRNFEFKPEIHLVEPEEDQTVFQLVSKRGAVWSEGEDLLELCQGYLIKNGAIWGKRSEPYQVSGEVVNTYNRVALYPACKL